MKEEVRFLPMLKDMKEEGRSLVCGRGKVGAERFPVIPSEGTYLPRLGTRRADPHERYSCR